MLIDWFTVVAQILNFLILIGLLKHFLYKPILDAVDIREKQIADQVGQAETLKIEAGKSLEEFQHKNQEFQLNSTALMNAATAEADKVRVGLIDEAKKEADRLKESFKNSLKKEQEELSIAIGRHTQQEVFTVAKKMLFDMASISLEDQIIASFIERINGVSIQEKESISLLFQDSKTPVLIRSAFDMSTQQREFIESAMQKTFSVKPTLQFESAPNLISGIECVTNNYKLCWSISDYLTTLETTVATNETEALP